MLCRRHLLPWLLTLLVAALPGCVTGGGSAAESSAGHKSRLSDTELLTLVEPLSDADFSGYYLDIEKTMSRLGVTRLEAHEIQNYMRDAVEERSQSFSPLTQKPFLRQALSEAVERVTVEKATGSGYAPRVFRADEFIVALDLDETLLSQWYRYGSGVGTFAVDRPDMVPNFVDDETGDSVPSPEILVSAEHVQMRPGVRAFMERVAKLPGFAGFVIFTAKEDAAALALQKSWSERDPEAMRRVVGFFTRNHLRFDPSLKKASKDLRLVDPTLEHVFLVDDNEGRVMQRDLTYRIPQFNADMYLASTLDDQAALVRELNEALLPYVGAALESCVLRARPSGQSPTGCFRDELGRLDEQGPEAELEAFLAFARQAHRLDVTAARAKELSVFQPSFHPAARRPTQDRFPAFKAFRLVDGAQLLP